MNLHEHLQPLPTELLLAMAKGEVDTQAIAARLMAERGLDQAGRWIGFSAAAQMWGPSAQGVSGGLCTNSCTTGCVNWRLRSQTSVLQPSIYAPRLLSDTPS